MSAISRKSRQPRQQKPPYKTAAKLKLVRFDPSDLAMVERACRKLSPSPSSSYFIVQAAVARARSVLGPPSSSVS